MCNLKQNCFAIDDCGLDVCGVYSSCNDNDNPICKCLPGFQPISEKEWDSGKWDAGCLPSTPSGCRNDDGFVQLKRMRVRNNPIFTSANSSDECKAYCLRDCACVACTYGLNSRSDCAVFYGELKGVQELEEGEGLHQKNSPISTPVDLHVRVAAASLGLDDLPINHGGKRCSNCGANIIPYPLSTGPNCGDPAYRGFSRKNTILLLSCSDSPSLSSLRCTSAEVCKRYMSGDDALCFASRSCCSYTAGRLPLTSHSISISGPNCSAYTSFVNANLSQLKDQWVEGVEISWKASLEPVCDSSADCRSWPNSRCSTTPSGQKRCICNANFQWDPFQLMCTGGDH